MDENEFILFSALYYSHLHMAAAGSNGVCYGGHLNRAIVSATCEMFINIMYFSLDRYRDETTGLNLFDL